MFDGDWRIERKSHEIRVLQEQLTAAMTSTSRAALESAIAQTVQAIEIHGCSTEFVSQRTSGTPVVERELKVLSLDLVWLSPGPLGSYSQRGKQACYCIRGAGAGERQPNPSWYQRALKDFFSTHNCRSLLTYPDIFTRPLFLEVRRLEEVLQEESDTLQEKDSGTPARPLHEIWLDEFEPDPHADQSAQQWRSRFDDFRAALRTELRDEFGRKCSSDAILAWVYVSSGSSQPEDPPPPWAASMFLLFRFEGLGNMGAAIDRDLNLLLKNLSEALQLSSQKCLPDTAKHDITQALAHEFKNLNQDVAILSHLVMRDFMNLPKPVRTSEFDTLRERLNALHAAAQATTAFSTAAYWLAAPAPTWKDLELRPDDEHCSIFKHVLFLAIRLIAQTREHWTLHDVPDLPTIVSFLQQQLKLPSDGRVAELLSNRCISIMTFFALEPVRNIRSNCVEHPEVIVSVEARKRHVVLSHQTTEIGKDERIAFSKTIKALMQITRDNARLTEFIHIDPDVDTRFEPTHEPNIFRVRRRTTIRVEQIPYPRF